MAHVCAQLGRGPSRSQRSGGSCTNCREGIGEASFNNNTLALAFAALSSMFPVQLCSFQRSSLVPNVQLFRAKVASERPRQKILEKISSLDWPLGGCQLRFIRNDLGLLKFTTCSAYHKVPLARRVGGYDLVTIVFLSVAFYYLTQCFLYKKNVFLSNRGYHFHNNIHVK